MPELKKMFSAARMNKDLDERLVPQGEYRDATNIEISTSEGSNSGVVQTLKGNVRKAQIANFPNRVASTRVSGYYDLGLNYEGTCVGSIAAHEKDKIYYFVHSSLNTVTGTELNHGKDYILEFDTITETNKYVFVDIFRVNATITSTAVNDSTTFHIDENFGSTSVNQTGIRIGMNLIYGSTYDLTNTVVEVTDISYDTTVSKWKITVDTAVTIPASANIRFTADKVLEFDKNNLITAINILEDFIFWTDNINEPKKIHIKRSMFGTGGSEALGDIFNGNNAYFHTRLVIDDTGVGDNYHVVTNAAGTQPVFTDIHNVTVIKKAPVTQLELDMYRTSSSRVNTITGIENAVSALALTIVSWDDGEDPTNSSLNVAGNPVEVGTEVTVDFLEPVDFRLGDVLIFALESAFLDEDNFEESVQDVRAVVTEVPGDNDNPNVLYSNGFKVEVLSIQEDVANNWGVEGNPWKVRLEDKDPLFNFKFPRFSYRYKYIDGEYSTFAPWSEIAFLPGNFDYQPKRGHNLGMKNQMRGLKIKNYHPSENTFPQDVVEIDILYKETNNTRVYTVKTFKKSDGYPLWPDTNNYPNSRGEFDLTTDMIHAVVPSNQLLRPWDNVPRKALCQEITANRLVYANYLQGYDIAKEPIIKTSFTHEGVNDDGNIYPLPSVKTMRDYQIGVVFSDRFGRETPVLTNKDSSIRLDKKYSKHRNRIKVNLDSSSEIPSWAEYYSFYIKETSVEYYTLSMDRWYNASDGNIWLSFPSSERNKMKEEDFLILKKAHGSDQIVSEKAKYKILSISNEAPDFIKTRKLTLGKITNDDDIGTSGNGFPLVGFKEVNIKSSTFTEEFGDSFVSDRDYEKLFIRVWAGNEASLPYEVTNIADAGDHYTLTLVHSFGEDVSITSTENTYESRVDDVAIELLDYKIQNLPEFDGRFFVKIFKDDVLENHVANDESTDWYIKQSWRLGYINNNGYVNAGTRTGDTNTAGGFGGVVPVYPVYPYNKANLDWDPVTSETEGDSEAWFKHYSSWNYTYGRFHPTEHNWYELSQDANEAFTGATSQESSYSNGGRYKFLTGVNNSTLGAVKENMETCTVRAINGWGKWENGHDFMKAKHFWWQIRRKKVFWIDACTAAVYGGRGNHGNNFRPGTKYTANAYLDGDPSNEEYNELGITEAGPDGFQHLGSFCQNFWFNRNEAGATAYLAGGSADFFAYGVPEIAGADVSGGWQFTNVLWYDYTDDGYTHQGGNSAPSRGIWTDGTSCFMDISWSSFNNRANEWNVHSSIKGIASNVHDDAYTDCPDGNEWVVCQHDMPAWEAWEFIKEFVTPGTKFRFRRCPDQQVYTVRHFGEGSSNAPHVGEFSSWAFHGSVDDQLEKAQYGVYGIRNVISGGHIMSGFDTMSRQYFTNWNNRQRWTVRVEPFIGGPETESGYNPIHGTDPNLVTDFTDSKFRRALQHDGLDNKSGYDAIEILTPFNTGESHYSDNPAIWETEPREAAEVDIYYQASHLIPININSKNIEEFIPIGSKFKISGYLPLQAGGATPTTTTHTVTGLDGNVVTFTPSISTYGAVSVDGEVSSPGLGINDYVEFETHGNTISIPTATSVSGIGTTSMTINTDSWRAKHKLGWSNCWSFGNGVESDRIRDDFNAPQLDNGVKASATLANKSIREEHRKYGLIWSGLYNSNSGINDTNQFIMAEKITKEVNPSHGSIQAIKARDTRLVLFCEDKTLRAVTNKDALYNADGKPQLISSNAVIGDITAYQGDFGISKNPESLAVTPYNMYFTDVMRGKVLALSTEGVRPISDNGMKDYFADTMNSYVDKAIGTYDERKNEYNISLNKKYRHDQKLPTEQITVSYSEKAKGWTSFKTFYKTYSTSPAEVQGLEGGVSLNNNYYTFFDGHIWKHHDNETRNNFYTTQFTSDVTVLFNDQPEAVKSFNTINYEGSQAKITNWDDAGFGSSSGATDGIGFYNNDSTTGSGATVGTTTVNNVSDNEYYNIPNTVSGWYVDNIATNLQECETLEFKDKEGKWFAYPTGAATNIDNLDEKEFSVQGLGIATMDHDTDAYGDTITITTNDSDTSSSGANWE
jgi:hypothetical protein